MCLIAVLPEGVMLSRAQIADAMSANADGLGVMYSKEGQLKVIRSMTSDPRSALRLLNRLPEQTVRVVHFRKRTAGTITRNNLHPFIIQGRFGLMHNGTLPDNLSERALKDKRSDTAAFAEDLLEQMSPESMVDKGVWKLIDAAVENNRLVMLDGETGKLFHTAHDMWTEGIDGIMLSNTYSFKEEALWGVKKTTFAKFHGYTSWSSRDAYEMYDSLYSPTAAKVVDYRSGSSSTPGVGGAAPRPSYYTPADDLEVLRLSYGAYQSSDKKTVPCSSSAAGHKLYGLAQKLMADTKPLPYMTVAPSTFVIAIIHAKLTQEEIDVITPDRVTALVNNLVDFATASDKSCAVALMAHYKGVEQHVN